MNYKWNIIGHEKQIQSLERDIDGNNIAHAYLFSGAPGIGKTLIAKTFAIILQCPNNFCRKCPTCVQVQNESHFDTIFIPDTKESIKIEEIRGLIQSLTLSVQSRYKLVLIKNIERMTNEAANSLLKTLEEPNPKTIFLLTTSNLGELPSTILSRVRAVTFYPFVLERLTSELKVHFPESTEERIGRAVSFSMGLPSRAIQLLKNDDLLNIYQRIYNLLVDFFESKDLSKRFHLAEELSKSPDEIDIFLEILLYLLRKKLLEDAYSDNKNLESVYNKAKETIKTKRLLKKNINGKLLLENLMLAL